MAEILTTNQLAEFEASVMRALRGESAGPSLAFVRIVYSSHEALRAALDAERKRADEAVKVSAEKLAALINPELSDARMAMIAVAEARAARAEANLAAARARVEELEREAVIDLHSTNAIRDDLAAANECIERQNANVRRLEADLAAMTERATKAEVELMDHLVGTEGVRRAIVLTQEQTRKAEDARDAALSRCAEVEDKLDVTQRALCGALALIPREDGTRETPRDVALRLMPADSDRLFPPEKGGE
jgi:chromosome segregation ATPase